MNPSRVRKTNNKEICVFNKATAYSEIILEKRKRLEAKRNQENNESSQENQFPKQKNSEEDLLGQKQTNIRTGSRNGKMIADGSS